MKLLNTRVSVPARTAPCHGVRMGSTPIRGIFGLLGELESPSHCHCEDHGFKSRMARLIIRM